jgi:hypothetical protein
MADPAAAEVVAAVVEADFEAPEPPTCDPGVSFETTGWPVASTATPSAPAPVM